ncbi:hypothetical protein F5144DRAFT_187034 [Chaetomium tenue]|uniref:Uncharacterized protein n=1 Tax=Chaetomium tenue TaxID=1854479 RepID=A0ACB7PGY1_9PEZI|nr:hypothetical protein F5144DRAFT_187034 [Chaetomium globosum]
MSAPSARHGRTQSLQERSNSQTNKPGIRLVPYSPPRLDPEDRAPSQASSRENRSSGLFNDQASSNASHSRRTSWRDEVTEGQGSALSSPTARRSSLARSRDERVSGVKPLGSPSTLGPAGPTAPTLRSPSEVSTNTTDFNAPAPRRSRAESSPSPATAHSRHKRSDSRRGTLRLAVHPNGTFSLVPEEPQSDTSDSAAASVTGSVTESATESATESQTSHLPSYTSRTPSAQDRASTDTWSERRSSTPLTGASTVVLDQSFSAEKRHSTPSRASSSTQLAEDPSASSPWNYRLVGGLRKVPSTPDNKGKQAAYASSTSSSETQLPPLPEASSSASEKEEDTSTRTVVRKTSFSSGVSNQTIQTVSEATNYKVYGPASTAQESRDSLAFNSAGPSNWEVLGQSSPAPAFPSRPTTASQGGDENYVLHGAPSVSPSSSLAAVTRKPRPEYSQESLVVAPLRPAKKPSYERFGYYKQRSRETLRSRTGSVQSLKSLSSIITGQDPAQALLTGPVVLNLPASSNQRFPWSIPERSSSRSSNHQAAITLRPQAPMLQSQPHQWSSQLSTVMSESEGGSDPARSVSPLSEGSGGHQRRRSSTGWVSSMHSRQLASISSSMAGQLDEAATTSASDSLERPPQTYARAGPSQIRMIRDQDEHGDGLADLEHRPSKTGLAALFANSGSWNLHSNSSSRANSFNSQIPAWARVYYGSGERRFLGRRPSFLTISDSGDSRPPSSGVLGSESPNTDNFPQAIFSPRRRAREVQPNNGQQRSPDQASMEISPAPQGHDYNVFRTLRQKTSSIWSPHLQPDRRATRYSVWDPPSVSWSADSSVLGRRNAQVLLFIIGFIFPLAWMVAAFLPLPPNPKSLDVENGENKYTSTHPAFRYQKYAVDETRYESARWWRNLNRGMSIIGLLIIGAVVALAVIGVRQGWGH